MPIYLYSDYQELQLESALAQAFVPQPGAHWCSRTAQVFWPSRIGVAFLPLHHPHRPHQIVQPIMLHPFHFYPVVQKLCSALPAEYSPRPLHFPLPRSIVLQQ